MCEHVQASLLLLALDGASHHFVADESVIHDPFDIGVVF
jgi:hypothetical protein